MPIWFHMEGGVQMCLSDCPDNTVRPYRGTGHFSHHDRQDWLEWLPTSTRWLGMVANKHKTAWNGCCQQAQDGLEWLPIRRRHQHWCRLITVHMIPSACQSSLPCYSEWIHTSFWNHQTYKRHDLFNWVALPAHKAPSTYRVRTALNDEARRMLLCRAPGSRPQESPKCTWWQQLWSSSRKTRSNHPPPTLLYSGQDSVCMSKTETLARTLQALRIVKWRDSPEHFQLSIRRFGFQEHFTAML